MARADGVEVELVLLGDACAQRVRGPRLPRAGDVVELALDGQQCGGLDVLRAHRLAVHDPGSVNQGEVLEHGADGVEVVLGRHVENGVVLVVELAVRLGVVVVAANEIAEVVVVRRQMAVRVHRHEARVLQEAGIDAPAGTREVAWHAVDDVGLEPAIALVHRQVIHRRRAQTRVNGATHHGHGARRGLAGRGHQ